MLPDAQRVIEERSIPVPFSGCWLWMLSTRVTGYGQLTYRGEAWLAHRLSYTAFKGPIPAGMLVQHSCDEPLCVNPDHLTAGTDATNNLDKQRKGRAAHVLTPAQVSAIRNDNASAVDIAADYGVSVSMIRKIRTGDCWSHIPGARLRRENKLNAVAVCLIRHMRRRGASLKSLGVAFDISPAYAQHVSRGRSGPSLDSLFEAA